MEPRKNRKGAGAGFIGVGVAFLVLASGGQLAFVGFGLVFIVLGTVLLAKSRQGG